MRIGVFGDSYASTEPRFHKTDYPTWFEHLESHSHQVTSFGLCGSSIQYSAKKIYQEHKNFDFLIWCVTGSERVTIEIQEPPYFIHSTHVVNQTSYNELTEKYNFKLQLTKDSLSAFMNYYKYHFNFDFCNIESNGLIHYYLATYPNLMIIPNFDAPLDSKFNLHQVDMLECRHYFPNITDYRKIHDQYTENRRCHMSVENNQILADIVASNLKPGIFQTELTNFVLPTNDVSRAFIKRN